MKFQAGTGSIEACNEETQMNDTTEVVHGTVEMVRVAAADNWTGLDLLPFETIAERFLDIEQDGQKATLTVSLAKPFHVEGRGWACPFRVSGLGGEQVMPAGGADSIHAIQMAMHMIHTQLTEMALLHKMSFLGTNDLGFGRVDGCEAAVERSPMMKASVTS